MRFFISPRTAIELYINDSYWRRQTTSGSDTAAAANTHPPGSCCMLRKREHADAPFHEDEETADVECQPPEKPEYSIYTKPLFGLPGLPLFVYIEVQVPMMVSVCFNLRVCSFFCTVKSHCYSVVQDTGHLIQVYMNSNRVILTDVCDVYYMDVVFPFEFDLESRHLRARFFGKERVSVCVPGARRVFPNGHPGKRTFAPTP